MGKSPFKKSVEIKAKYFPKDRIAIVHGERRITWRELNERVNQLASQLRKLCKVKRDDRISLIFWNSPQFVETNLAIQAVGAIPVPVNYRYVANELVYLINNSESDVLLFNIAVLKMV
ncbi:MAG: AMP-binding protein, partial [Promethearchaeota archaeon]